MGGRAHYSVIWGGVHWQKYNDFSVQFPIYEREPKYKFYQFFVNSTFNHQSENAIVKGLSF